VSFTAFTHLQALRDLSHERAVAQQYISKPLLISGRKFDIRIYALVLSASPLSVFIYRDGLVRFATIPHQAPATSNLRMACMHLTNYAINRRNAGAAGPEGSDDAIKWRLHRLFEHLASIGAGRFLPV
jgi:Tubulin-tyrosine ligase family